MTAATVRQSLLGSVSKQKYHVKLLKRKMNMSGIVRKFVPVFGACAIVVSLCSGCAVATGTPGVAPMNYVDLNYFQPDCRIRDQQVAMLMSMRQTPDQMLIGHTTNWIQPWQSVTNPDKYNNTRAVATGQTNWLIDRHLMYLRNNC